LTDFQSSCENGNENNFRNEVVYSLTVAHGNAGGRGEITAFNMLIHKFWKTVHRIFLHNGGSLDIRPTGYCDLLNPIIDPL
jgi:hypothetical protein